MPRKLWWVTAVCRVSSSILCNWNQSLVSFFFLLSAPKSLRGTQSLSLEELLSRLRRSPAYKPIRFLHAVCTQMTKNERMAYVLITLICDLNTFNALTYIREELRICRMYLFIAHCIHSLRTCVCSCVMSMEGATYPPLIEVMQSYGLFYCFANSLSGDSFM